MENQHHDRTRPRRVGWAVAIATALAGIAIPLTTQPAGATTPACDTSWTGSGTGTWSTAGSWDNGVPTADTVACLPAGHYTVFADGARAARGLVIGTGAGLFVAGDNSQGDA